MRITGTGHAGMLIETGAGSILCDPWVNPAYFASWFPFPDNSALDWDRLGNYDYLYVSHLHRDHFDAENLRRHVSKETTVLLPEYPTSDLEDELRLLGFTSFLRTRSGEPVALDGGQWISTGGPYGRGPGAPRVRPVILKRSGCHDTPTSSGSRQGPDDPFVR